MAWNPKALIDQVKSKKDDQNADKAKPAAAAASASASAGASVPAGASAPGSAPGSDMESPGEGFGSRVPPPPGGGSTWDPTKQPRRPSIAVFRPEALDDVIAGFKAKKQQRRVHFDVTPGELGMNPPSIAWFVCLTFTMFSLTLAVLFIAYYVNRPGANPPGVTNATKAPPPATNKSETVAAAARQQAPVVDAGLTDGEFLSEGNTVAIDVLYKLH